MPKRTRTNITEIQKTFVERKQQSVMYKNKPYLVTNIDKNAVVITPEGTFAYFRIHMFGKPDVHEDGSKLTLGERFQTVNSTLAKIQKKFGLDGIYLHAIYDSDIGRLFEVMHKLFASDLKDIQKRVYPDVAVKDQFIPDYQAGSGYVVITGKFSLPDRNDVTSVLSSKIYQELKAKVK